MILLILIIFFVIMYFVLKPYVIAHDTIVLYTGGNGSGKTFFSVKDALRMLKKNRMKVGLYNLFHKNKKSIPLLFSNIPIRVSRREMSCKLDYNPFILHAKMPEKCVVFVDEINLFMSQMQYKVKFEKSVNEYVTLYRHYTKGGYMILNTQNVSKVHWIFRYCCNSAFNLSNFKKPILGLPILACSNIRHINIGDDLKSVDTGHKEESESRLFGFFPFRRQYDTYCYSERVKKLPLYSSVPYQKLKTNSLLTIENKEYEYLINEIDD